MTEVSTALLAALAIYTECSPEVDRREIACIGSVIQERALQIEQTNPGTEWETAVRLALEADMQFQGLENIPAEIPDDERWNICVKMADHIMKKTMVRAGFTHFYSGHKVPWWASKVKSTKYGNTHFVTLKGG